MSQKVTLAVRPAVTVEAHGHRMTNTLPLPPVRSLPLFKQHPANGLVGQLHTEWQGMSHRRSALAQARSWQLPVCHFDSLQQLVEWAAADRPYDLPDDAPGQDRGEAKVDGAMPGCASYDSRRSTDPLMAALMMWSKTDDLAARIVLQRMLPGLCASARRRATGPADRRRRLDELVSVAWTVIRSFDESRYDGYVVAKLVRGCEYRAFDKDRRRKLSAWPTAPDQMDMELAVQASPDPLEELVELMVQARDCGGLSADDLDFLAIVINAPTVLEAARRLNVTARTVRNHRDAVTHRLRSMLAA